MGPGSFPRNAWPVPDIGSQQNGYFVILKRSTKSFFATHIKSCDFCHLFAPSIEVQTENRGVELKEG